MRKAIAIALSVGALAIPATATADPSFGPGAGQGQGNNGPAREPRHEVSSARTDGGSSRVQVTRSVGGGWTRHLHAVQAI